MPYFLNALGQSIAFEITGSRKPPKSSKVGVVFRKGPFHSAAFAVHEFVTLLTCVLHPTSPNKTAVNCYTCYV